MPDANEHDEAQLIRPIVGDPVMVTVPGRIFQIHEMQGVPGAFISAGATGYWVPLSEIHFHDAMWYAEPDPR